MHCRSFFRSLLCPLLLCPFSGFICYGARTSGRRPWPGVGGTPRVAGLFLVAALEASIVSWESS